MSNDEVGTKKESNDSDTAGISGGGTKMSCSSSSLTNPKTATKDVGKETDGEKQTNNNDKQPEASSSSSSPSSIMMENGGNGTAGLPDRDAEGSNDEKRKETKNISKDGSVITATSVKSDNNAMSGSCNTVTPDDSMEGTATETGSHPNDEKNDSKNSPDANHEEDNDEAERAQFSKEATATITDTSSSAVKNGNTDSNDDNTATNTNDSSNENQTSQMNNNPFMKRFSSWRKQSSKTLSTHANAVLSSPVVARAGRTLAERTGAGGSGGSGTAGASGGSGLGGGGSGSGPGIHVGQQIQQLWRRSGAGGVGGGGGGGADEKNELEGGGDGRSHDDAPPKSAAADNKTGTVGDSADAKKHEKGNKGEGKEAVVSSTNEVESEEEVVFPESEVDAEDSEGDKDDTNRMNDGSNGNRKSDDSSSDSSIGDEEDEISDSGRGGFTTETGSISGTNNGVADGKSDYISGGPRDQKQQQQQQQQQQRKMSHHEKPGAATVAGITRAAANVADSVATGFRGRYSVGADAPPASTSQNERAKRLQNLLPLARGNSGGGETNKAAAVATATGIAGTKSQTALILQSAAASHMQDILSKLSSDQYVMLLGNGMLGVNLKQTYLKNSGVYIDYIVPGGSADRAGVISVGDVMNRVGDTDVSRGTIYDVPRIIANAKRPVVLVLTAGQPMKVDRMDCIDVAVGTVNKIREEGMNGSRGMMISAMPLTGNGATDSAMKGRMDESSTELRKSPSLLDKEEEENEGNDGDEDRDGADDKKKVSSQGGENMKKQKSFSFRSKYMSSPPSPSKKVKKSLAAYASKRNNEMSSFASLAYAATNDEEFRSILRDAFNTCTLDSRRLPFLAAHFAAEDDKYEGGSAVVASSAGTGRFPMAQQPSSSTRLVLYLELQSFAELYGVAPVQKRRDHAKRIAYKFLLPKPVGTTLSMTPTKHVEVLDNTFEPPMFDVRNALSASILDGIERAISEESTPVKEDIFLECQRTIEESLTGSKFVSFLISDECARMRAYLRNTAPYVNVPLPKMFDSVVSGQSAKSIQHAARNHLHYAMMHLICQSDRESNGENDDANSNDRGGIGGGGGASGNGEMGSSKRLVGSAGGVCCALYIKRDLAPLIEQASNALGKEDSAVQRWSGDTTLYRALIKAFEHLWEVLVAPGGGALDSVSHSNEAQGVLDTVRRMLVQAVTPPKAMTDKAERSRYVVSSLTSPDLSHALNRLSEELFYEYAVNGYPKYRAHKFHEWMCAEVSKESSKHSNEVEKDEDDSSEEEIAIPSLPEGCIARLMRRVELPEGVSSHKPVRLLEESESLSNKQESMSDLGRNLTDQLNEAADRDQAPLKTNDEKSEESGDPVALTTSREASRATCGRKGLSTVDEIVPNPNAEYAIVFGTCDGVDSAGRIPNPAMALDQGTLRRFACVSVCEDSADEGRSSSPQLRLTEDCIPATLESYAVVPPFRERPFGNAMDGSRVSDDGWEASLINFMIPNAYASNAVSASGALVDSSIYGVSLLLHRSSNVQSIDESFKSGESERETLTELVHTEDFETVLDKSFDVASPSKKDRPGDNSQHDDSRDRCIVFDAEVPVAGEVTPPPLEKNDSDFLSPTANRIDPLPRSFPSPISFSATSGRSTTRRILVSSHTPEFNRRLRERRWSQRLGDGAISCSGNAGLTIGVVLISRRNVIPAMRESLSRLFDDYTRSNNQEEGAPENREHHPQTRLCAPLADVFGNLSNYDVEKVSLRCILEPYLKYGSSRWVGRPLLHQKLDFEKSSGQQLAQSLPPIPLALLFITALLEQKVILSSSRRSILLSACSAITQLLRPLQWSHLYVPLVPAALAKDLVQYPAPFILGIPSEDQGSVDLLNSLPDDVTLVDLDVGRVILASSFGKDSELLIGDEEEAAVAGALRSQVLYLAEALGSVFGAHLHGQTWCCDSPLSVRSRSQWKADVQGLNETVRVKNGNEFETIQSLCQEFIVELLSGATSCCYWIEEQSPERAPTADDRSNGECTVLLDEDRFFHIKNLRAQGRYLPLLMGERLFDFDDADSECDGRTLRTKSNLALSLDDFDLILESFLRCQSMSTFISSCDKTKMAYW